jgi:hypothetical protein
MTISDKLIIGYLIIGFMGAIAFAIITRMQK